MKAMGTRGTAAAVLLAVSCGQTPAGGDPPAGAISSEPDIRNPGFEEWAEGAPAGWRNTLGAVEAPNSPAARVGRAPGRDDAGSALRLEGDTSTGRWFAITQGPIEARPGERWRLEGWIRTSGVDPANGRFRNCNFFAKATDRTGNPVGLWTSGLVTGTTDWRRRLAVFEIPPGAAEIEVGAFLSLPGAAEFDDLRLVRLVPAPPPPPAATREERWTQDIRYFARELPRLHPEAFHSRPEAAFRVDIESLIGDLPRLTDLRITGRLVEIAASLGDEHTYVSWSRAGFSRLPIEMRWFRDGLFVTMADPAHRDAVGMRVISIGDSPVLSLLGDLRRYIPHRNISQILHISPVYLVTPEFLLFCGAISETGTVRVRLESAAGERSLLDLAPLPRTADVDWTGPYAAGFEPPLSERNRRSAYHFERIPGAHALYIQYNECREVPADPFADFTRRVVRTLEERKVRVLVIDLRHNEGGNSEILNPLLDALARPEIRRRYDRLYVVIGRATFSSGLLNAISLKERLGAVLVGEPTGGSPGHFGWVQEFRLPNSGLRVVHSTQDFGSWRAEKTLLPDFRVDVAGVEYFAGRDPVLDAILAVEVR